MLATFADQFMTSYSLLQNDRIQLEKGSRIAEKLQTFGVQNLIFSPKKVLTAFWGRIA